MRPFPTSKAAETIPPELIDACRAIRQKLHSRPELSGQEIETAALVRAELGAIGFEIQEGMSGTAVVALWPGLDRTRSLALRADMDALPLQEQSGLAWASERDKVMHACGHDGHTSVLLGLAKYLAYRKQPYPIDIKLIFQPAEETGLGARQLIADGAMEKPKVEAIFGLHGWPSLPLGLIGTRPGPIMASVDNFQLRVKGKGGHGAQPHLTLDPVVAAAQFITLCQSLISRGVDPRQSAVLTFGQIAAGSTYNVIPATCELKGTVRTLDPDVRRNLLESLDRLRQGFFGSLGMESVLTWIEACPATINDSDMAALVQRAAVAELGEQGFRADEPSMASEDFSFFLEKTRGAYFWLGLGDVAGSLHSPGFDFNDKALEYGVRIFRAIIDTYFAEKS